MLDFFMVKHFQSSLIFSNVQETIEVGKLKVSQCEGRL
jgi:hypothetical protein